MHSTECSAANTECGLVNSYDVQKYFRYSPGIKSSFSAVSSVPMRVCLCHHDLRPHSYSDSAIEVYPGEPFTLSAVVVGADFGATVGTVHATLAAKLKPADQHAQWIANPKVCSQLNYTVFSRNKHEAIYFTATDTSLKRVEKTYCGETVPYDEYLEQTEVIDFDLLTRPLLIDITLLGPCPPGFTLSGDPPGCSCHSKLNESGISCYITNRTGFIAWNGPMWVNASMDDPFGNSTGTVQWYTILIAHYCPFDLCKVDAKKDLSLA